MRIQFNRTSIPVIPFVTALLITFLLGLLVVGQSTSLAQEVTGSETAAAAANSGEAVLRQISQSNQYQSVNTLPPGGDWMAISPDPNSNFGVAVAYVGDINGDGYDDALVGADWYDGAYSNQGQVAMFYGTAEGLAQTPGTILLLQAENAQFGRAVAAAGDLDNDGYADILTAAPHGGPNGSGLVFVDYGSATGPDFDAGTTLVGQMPGDRFGHALAAGDINGNGYIDVVVGAPGYQVDSQPDSGAVFVYYGGPTGLSSQPDWQVESTQANSLLGYALAVGDFNDDGYADIAIGAKSYNGAYVDSGAVFIFYGSALGPAGGPVATEDNADWAFYGEDSGHFFGASLASGGDVNGDGIEDLVVGAPGFGFSFENFGAVYGYWGSESGFVTQAFDWLVSEYQEGSMLGMAVTIAGDINNNGFDDVVAGAPMAFPPTGAPLALAGTQGAPGVAYLYIGTEGGPGSLHDFYVTSYRSGSRFGHALSGNGRDSVLVGAPEYALDDGTIHGAAFSYSFGPIAGLTAINSSPTPLGEPTFFAAELAEGGPAQFEWDFGDGNMAAGQFVMHTYDQPGLYTAVVTASSITGTLVAETAVTINVPGDIDPDTGGTLNFLSPMGWGIGVEVPAGAVERRMGLAFVPLDRDEIDEPLPPNPSTYFFDLDPVFFPTHTFLPYISKADNGVDSDSQISRSPALTGNSQPVSIGQDTFPFLRPITVTVTYTDDQIRGLDEETLTLNYWDGTGWPDAATTCDDPAPYVRDPDRNRFTLQICHLTRFGMVGN